MMMQTRRIFVSLAMMFALCGAQTAFAAENDDLKFLQKGRDFNQARQYASAVSVLNQAVAINPRLVEAYFERGAAQCELAQYSLAISDCNKCLQLDTHYFLPYVVLGDCYTRLHQLPKALENYSKYIEYVPGSAQAYFSRAKVYDQMGQADRAKADRTRGARNEASVARELNLLTVSYGISGAKLATAKNEIITKDPYNRFNTLRRMLIEGCNDQLKKAPFSRRWYLNRGRLYRDTRQFEKAIADYTQVLNIPPAKGGHVDWNMDQTLFDRGELYMNVGDYVCASADYARIIAIDDDSEEAFAKKAECEFALKKYEQAAADYSLAIKHQIYATGKIYNARAKAYDKMGKKDLAEQDRKLAKETERKI